MSRLARKVLPDFERPLPEQGDELAALAADTIRYYDDVADQYARTVPDWPGAVARHAEAFHELIVSALGPGPHSILDCTCGVGTQVLGLARRGHRVVGTDISPQAIEQAQRHARLFGLDAAFAVADVRDLGGELSGSFDVVLSADNSLPHLLSHEAVRAATAGIFGRLRPGGLLLLSMRDYDRHLDRRPSATQPQVWNGPDGDRVAFQTWDWLTEEIYRAALFVLQRQGDRWQVRTYDGATYRAWRRSEISAFLVEAGFSDIHWRLGASMQFHQPIVSCRRPVAPKDT